MLMTIELLTVFLFRYLGVDDVTLHRVWFISESHKTESRRNVSHGRQIVIFLPTKVHVFPESVTVRLLESKSSGSKLILSDKFARQPCCYD